LSRGLIERFLFYDGSLEFQQVNDEVVTAGYQHKYVVEKYLDYIKYKKVLDAGCWTGAFEQALVEKGVETALIGLDENESALDIARRNFPSFKFLRARLTAENESLLANYEGYFNSIIFLDVIEHLPRNSEVKVMRFLHTLLKNDGVIVLSTMLNNIFNFIDPAWFSGHRHYKLEEINKILKDSGFNVVEEMKIGNLYWDIDLLLFYIYKHILRKKYYTSRIIQRKIMQGVKYPKIPTRLYLLAKKFS